MTNSDNKIPERKALGRGLSALLGGQGAPQPTVRTIVQGIRERDILGELSLAKEASSGGPVEIEITKLEANSEQPRKYFNEAKIEELSLSIKEQGIVQPILVKPLDEGRFQIIAGERRFRAAQKAGLTKVPVVIRKQGEEQINHDLISLIENVQREDLNPVELAEAYDRLIKNYQFTQEQIAQKMGVSRVKVANTLRLLRLPAQIRQFLIDSRLSEGHARAILALQNEKDMEELGNLVIEQGLSVRDVEASVREKLNQGVIQAAGSKTPQAEASANSDKNSESSHSAATKDPELVSLEQELRELFGTKVVLSGRKGAGIIEIYYTGADSLHRIIHTMRAAKK